MPKIRITGLPKMNEGGGFKINPKHRGYCTPMTKSTCTGRRRQFAINAKNHFQKQEDGGQMQQLVDYEVSGVPPVDVMEGGYLKQISDNPFDGGTYQSVGRTHENGGMIVDTDNDGRANAEIETDETLHTSPVTGDKYVGGNLVIPGTKTKFKAAFKDIAKQENKATKTLEKAGKIAMDNDVNDKYGVLSHNSAKVMTWSALNQQKALAAKKEHLSQVQQNIHDLAEVTGQTPKQVANSFKNGGSLPTFKTGRRLDIEKAKTNPLWQHVYSAVQKTARKYNLDPNVLTRQVLTENEALNPTLVSPAGAMGIGQFMPGTAPEYGLTPEILKSSAPQDIEKVIDAMGKYVSTYKNKYGNIEDALAAYNWGPGNVQRYKAGQANLPEETQNYLATILGDNSQVSYTPGGKRADYSDYSLEHPYDYDPNETYSARIPEEIIPIQGGQPHLLSVPTEEENAQRRAAIVENSAVKRPAIDFSDPALYPDHPEPKPIPSLADSNRLSFTQILPEVFALGDKPDFVPHQRLNPSFFQPYHVSFQDKLNENNRTFSAIQQDLSNNPEALASLAAQKYAADNAVLSEQFRTNQAIDNDVANKNTQLINTTRQAQLGLDDQQFLRQTQAKENTRANFRAAANSITNKIATNRAENNQIRLTENMFNYRTNPETGMMEYRGPKAVFTDAGATPNTMFNPTANSRQTFEVDEDGRLTLKKVTTDSNPYRATRRFFGGRV